MYFLPSFTVFNFSHLPNFLLGNNLYFSTHGPAGPYAPLPLPQMCSIIESCCLSSLQMFSRKLHSKIKLLPAFFEKYFNFFQRATNWIRTVHCALFRIDFLLVLCTYVTTFKYFYLNFCYIIFSLFTFEFF